MHEKRIPKRVIKNGTTNESKLGSKKRKRLDGLLDGSGGSENENPTKKAKTKAKTGQNDFGFLKMSNLLSYDIPSHFYAIEMGTDTDTHISHLDMITENVTQSAFDPDSYKKACQALLFLNESAELISIQEFNQNYIRLSVSTGNTFKIPISVSNFA